MTHDDSSSKQQADKIEIEFQDEQTAKAVYTELTKRLKIIEDAFKRNHGNKLVVSYGGGNNGSIPDEEKESSTKYENPRIQLLAQATVDSILVATRSNSDNNVLS